jgi:hypothetical protein
MKGAKKVESLFLIMLKNRTILNPYNFQLPSETSYNDFRSKNGNKSDLLCGTKTKQKQVT